MNSSIYIVIENLLCARQTGVCNSVFCLNRYLNEVRPLQLVGVSLVVYLLSRVQLFLASWAAVSQASLSFTVSQSWLKLMSIESVIS